MTTNHRPYYRGSSCVCVDCGLFLFDVRTGARLRALDNVDEIKLDAIERRFSSDPELAKRLAQEDLREVVESYTVPPESGMPLCEVCGDPLDHGQCKRCDWGQWSNAMGDGDQNPTDPTREFHPSIQASSQHRLEE